MQIYELYMNDTYQFTTYWLNVAKKNTFYTIIHYSHSM